MFGAFLQPFRASSIPGHTFFMFDSQRIKRHSRQVSRAEDAFVCNKKCVCQKAFSCLESELARAIRPIAIDSPRAFGVVANTKKDEDKGTFEYRVLALSVGSNVSSLFWLVALAFTAACQPRIGHLFRLAFSPLNKTGDISWFYSALVMTARRASLSWATKMRNYLCHAYPAFQCPSSFLWLLVHKAAWLNIVKDGR